MGRIRRATRPLPALARIACIPGAQVSRQTRRHARLLRGYAQPLRPGCDTVSIRSWCVVSIPFLVRTLNNARDT